MYTVYDHPKDYPDHYVVRASTPVNGQVIHNPDAFMVTKDLVEIPTTLKSMGLVKILPEPEDDPVILEIWL
jgi:hypothetical protein